MPEIASLSALLSTTPCAADDQRAQAALEAALPGSAAQYRLVERTRMTPVPIPLVAFETESPPGGRAVARVQRVWCRPTAWPDKQSAWRCDGPTAHLHLHLQVARTFLNLPEPGGIPDATVLGLVAYIGSKCFTRQLKALPDAQVMSASRADITSIRRSGSGFEISTGYSAGNTFTVDAAPGTQCAWKLRASSMWVSAAGGYSIT